MVESALKKTRQEFNPESMGLKMQTRTKTQAIEEKKKLKPGIADAPMTTSKD